MVCLTVESAGSSFRSAQNRRNERSKGTKKIRRSVQNPRQALHAPGSKPFVLCVGVRRGVSKGVEEGRRPPALRADHP
jgi:hypothetical protein